LQNPVINDIVKSIKTHAEIIKYSVSNPINHMAGQQLLWLWRNFI